MLITGVVLVLRPADADETAAAWRVALAHRGGPVALVLTDLMMPNLSGLDLARLSPHPLAHAGGRGEAEEEREPHPPRQRRRSRAGRPKSLPWSG